MDRVTIFRGNNELWQWRRRDIHGRIVSSSDLSFERENDCILNARANNPGALEYKKKHPDGTVSDLDDYR